MEPAHPLQTRHAIPLLALALLAACSHQGGQTAAAAAQPLSRDTAAVLGIFTEARTAGQDATQVRLLRGYLLGEDGRRDTRAVRAELLDLVRRAQLPDEQRAVASLAFLVHSTTNGASTPVGIDRRMLGRVVGEAVERGAADGQRPRFRALLQAELTPWSAPLRLDDGRPLAQVLTISQMALHLGGTGYEALGRALQPVLGGALNMEQSAHVLHEQVNQVLGLLAQQFQEAAATHTPPASLPEFDRARQVLGTVERVSEFVFGTLFTGDQAQRIGGTIRTITRAIGAVVEIGSAVFSGGVTGLLSPNLINTVLGLFGISSDGAVEARLDQLQRTVEQIGQMVAVTRAEMHQRFDRIEGQIAQLYRRVDQMFAAMVSGMQQLANQMHTGFAGIRDLLRSLQTTLNQIHADVRTVYEAVRWYADENAQRAMTQQLVDFQALLAAAATGNAAAFAQARTLLTQLPGGEIFVRTAPSLNALGEIPGWLPNPTAAQSFARVAGIGVLHPLADLLGVSRFQTLNFACLQVMASDFLDLLRSHPELVPDRNEQLAISRELDTLLQTAAAVVPGLGDVIRSSARLVHDRALAADAEWNTLLTAFRPLLSLTYSGAGTPGPQLLDFLATPYFDVATGTTRLPFDDEDGGFTALTTWPPAPGSFPRDERVYEFELRRNGGNNAPVERFRRSPTGLDHLRLGIAVGLLRVVESSRGATEVLSLWWRVPSLIDDQELRGLDGTRLCDLELIPGDPALPPRVRIGGVPSAYQAGFAQFYSIGVQPRVRAYLRGVRDHVANQIQRHSAVVLQSVVELYAAAACLRFGGELVLEAAVGDPDFSGRLKAALDQPLVFHEHLLSGRFARQPNQTPGDYREQVVLGVLQAVRDRRDGSPDLPAELANTRFYDQLLTALPGHAQTLAEALEPLLFELTASRFRFAAVDEVRAALAQWFGR